jgi:hypothetical protein
MVVWELDRLICSCSGTLFSRIRRALGMICFAGSVVPESAVLSDAIM